MNTRIFPLVLTLCSCNVDIHLPDDETGHAGDVSSDGGLETTSTAPLSSSGESADTSTSSDGSDTSVDSSIGSSDAAESGGSSDSGDSTTGGVCEATALYQPHYGCDDECFGECEDDGIPLCVSVDNAASYRAFCSGVCATADQCAPTGLPAPWDTAACEINRCIILCNPECPVGYECSLIAGIGHCLPPAL